MVVVGGDTRMDGRGLIGGRMMMIRKRMVTIGGMIMMIKRKVRIGGRVGVGGEVGVGGGVVERDVEAEGGGH